VTRGSVSVGVALCLLFGATAPALAQSGRGRLEISGGGVFLGGFSFDERTAELTSNSDTGTGGTFDLFTTDAELKPAFGVRARVGVFVTPSFAVEGGLRFTKPILEVAIGDDTEDAEDTIAEETVSQYLFDASAVWHFGNARAAGRRAVPFVYGGAGYLRELHEGDALVEESVEYHAGGGVKWWLGAARRLGVRADVGVSIREGGVDFEDKRRIIPEAGASLVWVF
jgi:Outer membrane protein beta-barrel domain